ncbi:U32 family peptidase [Ferrimonas marina]|uniref:Peptidase family U32 n=1 Tax=Ferrimonas marina TaxID=299255 RepID=A0A1M5YGB7_9GAMM|nr:U32 family peptidase [Ferrimonas marina]SHI11087.1 Peptidase family U32 [Ferrimonas marina]
MKLSLAPNWWPMSRQQQHQWLERVAESPAQRVYLGENVCILRDRLAPRTLLEAAQALRDSGKEVILTSLNLVASERELALLERLCQQGEFAIEANDMAAVALAHQHGLPFVAGSGLNLYNPDSLAWMLSLGMTGYQPPLEMAAETLADLMQACQQRGLRDQFELELLGYGSPALAVSARCSTARAAGRNRQRCDKVCQHHGAQPVETLEGQAILRLNGTQVHGHQPIDLLGQLDRLEALGVDWLRVDLGPEGDGSWLPALAEALAQRQPEFTPPVAGARQFWQRQAGEVALFGD